MVNYLHASDYTHTIVVPAFSFPDIQQPNTKAHNDILSLSLSSTKSGLMSARIEEAKRIINMPTVFQTTQLKTRQDIQARNRYDSGLYLGWTSKLKCIKLSSLEKRSENQVERTACFKNNG